MPPKRAPVFACAVCAEDAPLARAVRCPGCDYAVCRACQQRYRLPSCMSCRLEFTRAFLLAALGARYVDTTLRRHQTAAFVEREKRLLRSSEAAVTRRARELDALAQRRFVGRPAARAAARPAEEGEPPPPPGQDVSGCPFAGCRGFVVDGACRVCGGEVCVRCGAALPRGPAASPHVCDPADVESVRLLRADTRPCPRCGVPIFRASGCNHMRCTACMGHFDWATGRPLASSSNAHYDGVARFRDNVVLRVGGPLAAQRCDDEDVVGLTADSVRRADQTCADAALLRSLYDDADEVRCAKRSLYDERRRTLAHAARLTDLRVAFVRGELDEAAWGERLFRAERAFARDAHQAAVVNMYLVTVKQVQALLRDAPPEEHGAIRAEWERFLALCNASFASLRAEYGGSAPRIRADLDAPDAPGFSLA
jgi:hypothetical protein